jgi:hypothetical protein
VGCLAGLTAFADVAAAPPAKRPRTIDWEELLPLQERGRPLAPPVARHDYLGEAGPALKQSGSFKVNAQLNGAQLRVPGFIVPLTLRRDGKVSDFFLVPYFGACIHVPPPPPNQIIYVAFASPQSIVTIYDAYWVTGVMTITPKNLTMAQSAYSMSGSKLEIYQ